MNNNKLKYIYNNKQFLIITNKSERQQIILNYNKK